MRLPTITVALLLAAAAPAAAQPGGILGRVARVAGAAVAARLPIGVQKEVEIGRGIAATVAGRWHLSADESLNEYVNLVGQVVAQQSPRANEITYRFAVLETDEVNAFAAPGGYIFVTRGALDIMDNEAELAAVLGHEIAHVDLKHILHRVQRADGFQHMTQEAQLSGPIMDQVLEFGASTLFTGLERSDELESDSLGLLYAVAAGYRGDGMARFLERMSQGEQQQERGFMALRATHPPASVRLEAVQADIAAQRIDTSVGPTLEERFRRHVPPPAAPQP